MAKLIRLTRGQICIVDDEDYDLVSQFKWIADFKQKTCYAYRHMRLPCGKQTTQYMHVLIMRTPKGMDTHHQNTNGCDNRRQNLEVLSRSAHFRTGPKRGRKPGTPGRGVCWDKSRCKWMASLAHEGQNYNLGRFLEEKAAREAFDAKARELGWPEAILNFPRLPN